MQTDHVQRLVSHAVGLDRFLDLVLKGRAIVAWQMRATPEVVVTGETLIGGRDLDATPGFNVAAIELA